MGQHPSAAVLDLVSQQAPIWFPELGGGRPRVVVENRMRRSRSSLVTLLIEGGGPARSTRRILVKTTLPSSGDLADRPRLGIGPEDGDDKHRLEWRGLVTAWEAFGTGRYPGLGAVRPLAHVPEERTLIVCRVDDPTLRARLMSASRLRPWEVGRDLPAILFSLGRWLGAFHRLRRSEQPRRATAVERAGVAEAYARFLEARQPTAARLARLLMEETSELDPDTGMGLGHGDFAPRNVFVGRGGEIRVIDVLARWRVPVYEDIASFLVELRVGGADLVLLGNAFPDRARAQLETSFLDGYSKQAGVVIDRRALAWHRGLVVLDRWAAEITRSGLGSRQRLRGELLGRRLDEETDRASAELTARVP